MKETKFKQTEVGMIPSDWEVKCIAEIGNIVTGSTPPRADSSLWGGAFCWCSAQDFKQKEIFETAERITEKGKKYCRLLPSNSVLVTCIASIGLNAIARVECATNQQINAIVCSRNFNADYVYYIIEYGAERLKQLAGQTAVPIINKQQFSDFVVAVPPTIDEQQRIANALSDVDTLIANLEKLIAKKKNIKQGVMQQLLTGKKRLPGFAPDERRKECHSERSAKCEVEESSGYKMTELGLIPNDWEVKTFGELFDILPNNTLSRAELNEDSGSFKNVHYGDVLVKFPEWIDCSKNTLPFINSGAKFNHTALQDGDVIIADTAEDETVGKSTEIYNVGKMKIVSGLHTIPIRPKKKFASKWLGYFINSACWHDQILPFITGTKVSAISKTAIAETKFFYPAKIDEQTAIANVLSDMDAEISALETKLAKYRTLKTGMMQQLLTGKIRLV